MSVIGTNITKPNDAWIIYRQDIDTSQDGACNVYFLMDAFSGYVFGIEASVEQPDRNKILTLFEKAKATLGQWPRQVMILKKDPFIDFFQAVCDELKLTLSKDVTDKEIRPYVQPLVSSFRQFKKTGPDDDKLSDLEDVQPDIEAFIPKTYDPCPCASGKKHKFCCQKIFRDITLAMCAAEEGKLEEALRHMQQAESKS